ncbi:MAG TPA: peptidyl-prolyl cis-trans isomerase [Candidatus Sulfotelmatobacter sp.]|nr:peptidyl-prolyl cis-trans isomerase [Candidatus Sulfotelmatobacter sp.]
MRTSWLVCAFLGALAWGQAAPGTPPSPPSLATERPQAPAAPDTASVPADAAVITVDGVCEPAPKTAASSATAAKPAVAKSPSADCKTIITKKEFETIMAAVPNPTPQVRRQVADALPKLIMMSEAAKKRGLDKTPEYKEMVKIQSMNVLSQTLTRKIQEDAANIPPEDIENYYKQNSQAFEQFAFQRLFVPRNKQGEAELKDEDEGGKVTEEQKKAREAAEKQKTEQGEAAMSKLAEDLRTRAVAGEDFAKLQREAYDAAGMKIETPTVTLPKVRRSGLPPAHAAVFDLKVGDVSPVFNDAGGHYIYKLTSKDQLTLDQAKDEIHGKLQNERSRDMLEKLNGSYKVDKNEAYFGAGGPPQRGPAPMMPPRPQSAPPAAGAQTPEAPTAKPN